MKHIINKAKSILLLLLAALCILSAACGKGTEQQTVQTEQPGQTGQTEQPGQTDGPADVISFNRETDYDNSAAAPVMAAVVETEDAYYLTRAEYGGTYLYYYDKTIDDSGVLCPRPECVHDEKPNNKDCTGYIGGSAFAELQYYEGKLWFYKSIDLHSYGLFHMNLDGSELTLVHTFYPEGTPLQYSNTRVYLHRGILYHASYDQVIKNGDAFERIVIGCMPMEDMTIGGTEVKAWEYYTILERATVNSAQPILNFAGDYVYMFYCYDGVEEYDGEPSTDDWAWWWDLAITDEITRWKPSMTEPEVLYRHENEPGTPSSLMSYNVAYVTQDGTPYFMDFLRADMNEPYDAETNPLYIALYRVENGDRTELFNTQEDGNNTLVVLGENRLVTTDNWYPTSPDEEINITIRDFGGDVIFTGPISMDFWQEPYGRISFRNAWVYEDSLILCFDEYMGSNADPQRRWYFVKYDITPDGLTETLLLQGEYHVSRTD
ncbi:MAG: hypothetical protein J5544_04915 [Clostridia bacterium]|nr:hypothetical protein [Clostridia bacterium]